MVDRHQQHNEAQVAKNTTEILLNVALTLTHDLERRQQISRLVFAPIQDNYHKETMKKLISN